MNVDQPILGLTGREAAEILGVSSEWYVYHLVADGKIPKARKHARRGLDRDDGSVRGVVGFEG